MKKYSNTYMMLYALGVALVVALLLTAVSQSLKSRQQANVRNEKMQQLLATIGIDCDRDEAYPLFGEHFVEVNSADRDGNPLHYYLYEKDGSSGVVIPCEGNGLWGPIYANVALASDMNTIAGITFRHEGETPGLGAEITSPQFCQQFIGKQILDSEGKVVSVAVVKHADPSDLHQVDAISGGTMTSNGVSDMLLDCLTRYSTVIHDRRQEAARKEVGDGQ